MKFIIVSIIILSPFYVYLLARLISFGIVTSIHKAGGIPCTTLHIHRGGIVNEKKK